MRIVTFDWTLWIFSAAAVKLPQSATAQNILRCLSSIVRLAGSPRMMKIQASTSSLMIDLRTRTQTRASLTRRKSRGFRIDRFSLRPRNFVRRKRVEHGRAKRCTIASRRENPIGLILHCRVLRERGRDRSAQETS
ncbi:hypothetical protein [Paraburkholderia sp. XV]|uniref:hypothetical protein n=1 Tax=Paraburkholderia sp. XV TaxID=2831520 RepID=UPI001CD519C0|nr:hypothetical protein [Paraburkholderia sp. XV]